jgi:hypothetical protein
MELFHACSFMGRLFVKALGKPSEILAKLNEMAGFPPDQEIELFEAILIFLINLLSR